MFQCYLTDDYFDEMFDAEHVTRPHYELVRKRVEELGREEILRRQLSAERALLAMGITFNVYGDEQGQERIFPFDIYPRVIEGREWDAVEAGLQQRITALNLFIDDVYNDQKIIKDGVVPRELIESCPEFCKPVMGLKPPRGIWCHITGSDLIRDRDGQFYVLEDNLRCPSGVSYVLINREIMKRTFPVIFEKLGVRPVYDYPNNLKEMLRFIGVAENPACVVLTPGIYNSAYFEHSFLAQQMGIELVQGSDLVVDGGRVMMRTTRGLERVDVIYRRIGDDFLDPQAFRPESVIGVPGLFDAYRRGNVALVNAPGTGVADDKVIYAYVPEIIRYYLKEEPKLNNVPTFKCWDKKEREHVLANIATMVVKEANNAGGYGMLVGPHASVAEHERFRGLIQANPRNYIAQPTVQFSRVPTIIGDRMEGRHVDLRPYILYGEKIVVMPGGLCRVALRKGSLVVNSSQGGGSKDCWVMR